MAIDLAGSDCGGFAGDGEVYKGMRLIRYSGVDSVERARSNRVEVIPRYLSGRPSRIALRASSVYKGKAGFRP
jgi:hypothetical protein